MCRTITQIVGPKSHWFQFSIYVPFKTPVFLIEQIPRGLSLLRYEKPLFTTCRAHSPATWGSAWWFSGWKAENSGIFSCLMTLPASPHSAARNYKASLDSNPNFGPIYSFQDQIWYCTAWLWMLQVHHNLYSSFEMSSDEKPSKTN